MIRFVTARIGVVALGGESRPRIRCPTKAGKPGGEGRPQTVIASEEWTVCRQVSTDDCNPEFDGRPEDTFGV